MDAQIRITGGTAEELAALGEWLVGEDELRGRVRAVRGPIGETELGPVIEALTVALGAGGAGTVLASSLKTWLVTRRTTAKITVESCGRSVTLDIQTVAEVSPLLEQILKAGVTTEAAVPANSCAVLIGVSAYEYAEFPAIRAARNSTQAMRDLLSDPALCGWPPERITVIANPISAENLAVRMADLAESTTGVLLLYYVGHGVLSDAGELCLTVTSTRPNRPKISGLPWDTVADVLRACPAWARLVILDCCFAGRAIEALSGSGGPGLADMAHVEGVYTLTATTRNRTAHVPPPDQQDTACTSFTGELRDLIRSGIPGKSSRLTFGDIYPVLRQRLRDRGLPTPSQRGTDTAHQFLFTANAATHVRDEGNSAGEAAQTVPAPARIDHLRAMRLVRDAERLAWSITGEKAKASALARVAQAVAASEPDRAARLIDDAEGVAKSIRAPSAPPPRPVREDRNSTFFPRHPDERLADEKAKAPALANVAQAVAAWDPDRAERLAQSITDDEAKASALANVAQAVAAWDPDRAERLAWSITDPGPKASALARVAQAVAAWDPDRAARLIDDAEHAAHSITGPLGKAEATGHRWQAEKASALARVAQAVAAWDPDRAARLIDDAEHAAHSITGQRWEAIGQRWEAEEALALARVAQAVAVSDPDRAERLAQSITDPRSKASALARVAEVLAVADPDRAERLAQSITDTEAKASALARVAQAVAASEPDRAARLIDDAEHAARSITGGRWQEEEASALARVAQAVAVSDPDRAERLAQSITDPRSLAQSITDPRSLAQSITIPRYKAAALARVAEVLALSDPDRAERLAQSITDTEAKVSALVCVARTGLQDL